MSELYVSGAALGALAVAAALAALMRGPALAFVYPLSALAAIRRPAQPAFDPEGPEVAIPHITEIEGESDGFL